MDRGDAAGPPPARHPPASPAARPVSRRASIIGTLVALFVVLAVGALAWYLTQRPPPAQPGQAARGTGAAGGGPRALPPTSVGVAVAERADIPVNLEALGTVVPAAVVRVQPQVGGVLQEVHYREGQEVVRGQLLATIDPRPFQMALQQAQGQRMREEAQLEAARVTLQRFRTLLQQDSIARQEVDSQAALVRQLEASLLVSRAAEDTARLNLSHTRVLAPIAGRVGLRPVDAGNVITPGDADGVAVIAQVRPVDVSFAVPQDRVGDLAEAVASRRPVQALDRTRAQVLATGTLLAFDNQVDVQTGTVRAKARFSNDGGTLFPSQFVNARLQLRTIEGAVVVPPAALRAGQQGDQVFVVREDSTVSLRPVRRGHATAEMVQVVDGLRVGERVVTEGADRLRDGARVTLPGQGGAAAASGRPPAAARGGGDAAPQATGARPRSPP